MRTAHIFGATGLIGGLLLREMLSESDGYEQIHTYGRRSVGVEPDRRLVQHIIDFDRPDEWREFLSGGDVFCCLGTTIKKAGNQDAFDLVDRVYPVRIAKEAVENGAANMVVVSSLGANARSAVFYNRVKGQMEQEVSATGIRPLHFFRPSLLLGNRLEKRSGERAAIVITRALPFLFIGPLAPYRPIEAAEVARAMLVAARRSEGQVYIHESRDIPAIR
jgi:uncharacterized protein YbjT (DUF2867 family)